MGGLRSKNWPVIWGVSVLLGLAVGLAILYGFGSASGKSGGVAPEVGAQAPDFELEQLSGGALRLSDLRGKPVLVNFWASWCAPCILEMPNIQKYYQRYPEAFEVVAVNADEPRSDIEKFVKDIGVTFPIVMDPGLKIQSLYRLRGLPTSFLVDADGIVRVVHIGMLEESQLEQYLSRVGVKQ